MTKQPTVSISQQEVLYLQVTMSGKEVIEFRKRRKKWSVEAFGGECGICGYNKSLEALEFHHIDPKNKKFSINASTVNMKAFIEELRKCVCLCANCHREVHSGVTELPENIKKFDESFSNRPLPEKPKHECKQCQKLISVRQTFCSIRCYQKSKEVIDWPKVEDLEELVLKNGYSATGRMLGVSDNAIRKRLKTRKTC